MSAAATPDADARALQHRVRELEAVAAIASSFTFEESLEAMMVEVSRQVVGASDEAIACIMGLSDRETNLANHVLGSYGTPPGFDAILEGAWKTAGTPVVSTSLRTRQPQVLELATVLKVPGYERVREEQERAGWTRMAVVPVIYRQQPVGLLIVAYPGEAYPDEGELAFLAAIADQAAVAIENARLFEQAQAAAVTEERQRLSRELHDSVSQALYGISLGAQTARDMLAVDAEKAAEPIAFVLSLAEIGLAEMRALIFELRPDALETEGLLPALQRQVTALRARHRLVIETELAREPDVSLAAKEMLYRVAQQALHNIGKHAQASEVSLSLVEADGALVLTVRDNGQGFVVADHYPGHLGVTSMRERAQRLGAETRIESSPGMGCTITVRLPL